MREDRDTHLAFLQHNLETILAFARQGFGAQGRGVVLIQSALGEMGEPWETGRQPAAYTTDLDGLEDEAPIRRMAAEYDPLSQAVVVVVHHDGVSTSAYRIGAL